MSIAVVVLIFFAASIVAGVDVGFGDRRRNVIGVLGAIVAIAFLSARAAKARHPGSPSPRWAPEFLLSKARNRIGRLSGNSSAGLTAAIRRARRRGRVRQVELAALEAAEDDDRLAPESVRTSAEALLRLVQAAWNERDRARLATLVSPDLLVGWEGSLEEGERAGVDHAAEVLGDVRIDYVGLTRGADGDDRAIVLIEATLGVPVEHRVERLRDGSRRAQRLCQYWTLGLRDGVWIVLAIEERAEGHRHLAEPIVARAPGP